MQTWSCSTPIPSDDKLLFVNLINLINLGITLYCIRWFSICAKDSRGPCTYSQYFASKEHEPQPCISMYEQPP